MFLHSRLIDPRLTTKVIYEAKAVHDQAQIESQIKLTQFDYLSRFGVDTHFSNSLIIHEPNFQSDCSTSPRRSSLSDVFIP